VSKPESFLGDEELVRHGPHELRKGILTRIAGLAISNAHQAAYCEELLTDVLTADDFVLMTDNHAKATCIEAAVGLVAEAEMKQGTSRTLAVDSLSKVLLARTGVWKHSDDFLRNLDASALDKLKPPLHVKNALQEAGGSIVLVEHRKKKKKKNHTWFRAVAALGPYRADSGAGLHMSRRAAESAAATEVLAVASRRGSRGGLNAKKSIDSRGAVPGGAEGG
jgi:hypothetical protein